MLLLRLSATPLGAHHKSHSSQPPLKLRKRSISTSLRNGNLYKPDKLGNLKMWKKSDMREPSGGQDQCCATRIILASRITKEALPVAPSSVDTCLGCKRTLETFRAPHLYESLPPPVVEYETLSAPSISLYEYHQRSSLRHRRSEPRSKTRILPQGWYHTAEL